MAKASEKIPVTPAVRALRASGIEFVPHFYAYLERGGTHHAAEALGVPEDRIIKTLVMEAHGTDGRGQPLLVLMHGDREVSTKQLARVLGVKSIEPAGTAQVERATGYLPGGVSPFGTRQSLPVYVESTILQLERIYINGGRRGFLVEISPGDLLRLLPTVEVQVATGRH